VEGALPVRWSTIGGTVLRPHEEFIGAREEDAGREGWHYLLRRRPQRLRQEAVDKGPTMSLPWLSVIVPSYNGERWLAAALQSVADQGDIGIEVILIDNSASAVSLQLAKGFADKLDLRTYRRDDLVSWTAKTNFGVEIARAEWICMLHQDDLWLPERSAALRQWLEKQSDAVMHLHPVYIIDERGRRLGTWRCPLPDGRLPVPSEMLLERLLVQRFISIPAPTIRRATFRHLGGLDDLWMTADWDLYLKIASAGNAYYQSTPLVCFRIHKNSLHLPWPEAETSSIIDTSMKLFLTATQTTYAGSRATAFLGLRRRPSTSMSASRVQCAASSRRWRGR
jgi:hypothetical protein